MRRGVAALAVAGLLSAGCGARWDDEQRAAVVARSSADGGDAGAVTAQGAGSGATGASSGGGAASGGATPVATGGAGGGASTGGSTGSAGGATGGAATPDGAAATDAGALPCAAPSDAPGVTDGEIAIGSISTVSGVVPGLGAPAAAAVRAYVEYRNSTGGVCGRQLVLQEADDGGDSARYRSIISEIEPGVIGFAGGLAIGDDGSADLIRDRAIPMIASRSAEGVQGQPTVFDLNPPYADTSQPIGKYDYLASQGVQTVALAWAGVAASRAEALIQRSLMEASGLQVVQEIEYPVATFSFDSVARSVANSGADYLLFIGALSYNASMAQSIADTGYELQYLEFLEFAYGTDFAELAGAAGEGATMWIRTLPTEESASNAEVAAFVEWMGITDPGLDLDTLAAESFLAAKALVDGLEALPGPITRQALVDQLRSVGTYDAGGMLAPIQLGAQINEGCFIGMQLVGGAWQRLAPAGGFLC